MIPLFQTQNAALASTLATCGVPFYKDMNGEPCPFLNIYNAEILRRMGFSGISLEEAARRAWRSGKKGMLVYSFERTALADRIIKAYDQHGAAIAAADAGSDKPGMIMTLDVEPEVAARICCQYVKNRNWFTEGWRSVTPFLSLQGASKTIQENGRTVVIGSFKLININASGETRKHIGL